LATFVLIHGAWHGGWCWYKVVARLEAAGHRVLAPDLLCLGADRTPVTGITLAQWTDQVTALVEAQPEPVVLVGHSRGGIIVSSVAERVPERVRHAVYLAAFMLTDGQSIAQVMGSGPRSGLTGNILFDRATSSSTVKADVIADTFYHQCNADDIALARLLLAPEPAEPSGASVHVTEARFGRVPRTFIECVQDRAIDIALQRAMIAALPGTQVRTLDTDHSPFFGAPDALCAHLAAIGDAAA
jgi:pimeloyl-ACP methyl ester carboxylesterase